MSAPGEATPTAAALGAVIATAASSTAAGQYSYFSLNDPECCPWGGIFNRLTPYVVLIISLTTGTTADPGHDDSEQH